MGAYLFSCLPTPPLSLQEKPVDHLSGRSRCGLLVGPLCSSLPPRRSVQSLHKHHSPERICIAAADWPGGGTVPRGSSTNGDSAAWLIGRGQVASLHFSFFCFKQQPLHWLVFFSSSSSPSCCSILFCHCEIAVWLWPTSHLLGTVLLIRTHLGLSQFHLLLLSFIFNACCDRVVFDWQNGSSCHSNPESLRSVVKFSPNFLLVW